jgi:hypothetical protein
MVLLMPASISPAPAQVECPNCGGLPMGEGCYHTCLNSVHFYSPEQERYDDANWSRADYMRETYGDPDLDSYYDDKPKDLSPAPVTATDFTAVPFDSEDIPF